MMTDLELIAQFNSNLGSFYATTDTQRREIYSSFNYRDCNQIEPEGGTTGIGYGGILNSPINSYPRKQTITVVNLAAPIVRAVAGSEVMAPSQIDYISIDTEFDTQADVISDSVDYCQYASRYVAERAVATEDAATCGLGATVTYLDMTQKGFIAGVPIVERVFSGFTAYDNSSRAGQLNRKAKWVEYADPVDNQWLTDYVDEALAENPDLPMGASDFKPFLMSFNNQENQADIGFIYHYFWYEFVPIYDVKNPFHGHSDAPYAQPRSIIDALAEDDDIAEMLGKIGKKHAIDWNAAYWSLDKDAYDDVVVTIETIYLMLNAEPEPLEYSKRKGKCYYRAEFANGYLIKRSRSYSQSCHPLNFITGYYDENQGVYYGLMRPLSYLQDALNINMSAFLGYAKAASHGGNAYIKGAGEAFERIRDARANEDDLTPIPRDAEVIAKAQPATPEVYIQYIRLMMELMPRSVGFGQEFLGIITSGDMTDSLFGKVMKQSYAVLEAWKNNAASYDMCQGAIFEDMVRLMADANDGMILPVLSPGQQAQTYFRLSRQSLARNYALRIVERPLSVDQKQETFNKLSQLLPTMQPEMQQALMPMLVRYANLDQQDKDEMVKAMQPQPQAPDPLNIATIEANINYTNASAKKADADAQKTLADAQATLKKIPLADDEALMDIRETNSRANLNDAKTEVELAKVFSDRMDSIERTMAERMNQLLMMNQMLMQTAKHAESQAGMSEAMMKYMGAPREIMTDDNGNLTGIRVVT